MATKKGTRGEKVCLQGVFKFLLKDFEAWDVLCATLSCLNISTFWSSHSFDPLPKSTYIFYGGMNPRLHESSQGLYS